MKIDYFKIINVFTKGTQASSSAAEGANDAFKNASAKNTAQSNVQVNQTEILIINQDVKFNAINKMTQAKLIKELMNIPNDIEDLLSMLVFKENSAETIEKLLKQPNLKLDINLIRQLLEGNSKETLNKLIKLFQQAPGGTQNTDQIKEITTLLSQLIPKKDATPEQILTNLTLLYLPIVPLREKQDLEIKIEKQKKQKDDESKQVALVVYITTVNLGRFRVSIILSQDSSVKIEIENFVEKKSENKKEHLEKILKEIIKKTRKDKVNAKVELLICEEKDRPKQSTPLPEANPEGFSSLISEQKETLREVIISPVKDVSPLLIITAQKIAKIILETDEKISLLETREKMISEES